MSDYPDLKEHRHLQPQIKCPGCLEEKLAALERKWMESVDREVSLQKENAALKSQLATAVEALENILKAPETITNYCGDDCAKEIMDIAKAALARMGEK